MSVYKVLYRKYRPEIFDEIVGQDHIKHLLVNAIKHDKISHAYLFSGPRGSGKTSAAKVFAKAVNCSAKDGEKPCLKCRECLSAVDSSDIIELDAASNNGVDEIREINNNVKLLPTQMKYKVYIVDEVHMLSKSAFNALLKTLEEPPAHIIFILATTNIESIPLTIISRCQRFDFKKISEEIIEEALIKVAKKEKIKLKKPAAKIISKFSDGSLRDALMMLEFLANQSEDITEEVANDLLMLPSHKAIESFLDLFIKSKKTEIIALIDDLEKNGTDFKFLLKMFIEAIAKKMTTENISKEEIAKFKVLTNQLLENFKYQIEGVNNYEVLKIIILDLLTEEQKETIIEEKIDSNWYEELKSTRINNCLFGADKEEKIMFAKKWEAFKKLVGNGTKGLIIDSELVAASTEIILIKTNIKYNMGELYENLNKINELFNLENGTNVKLAFISNERWTLETEKYKENLKNDIKYKYIKEKECERLKKIANNIFEESKIKEE